MRSHTAWRRAAAGAATLACVGLCAPVALGAPAPGLDTAAIALAVGSNGLAVLILQNTLNDWGVASPTDGRFTNTTVTAVKAAADQIGMAATDLMTQLAVIGFGPRAPQLQLGAKGPEVATLQRALTRAGDAVAATGTFGPTTKAEAQAFQQAHGLQPTGIVTLWEVEEEAAATVPAATAPTGTPAVSDVRAGIGRLATDLAGKPYAWGGSGPGAFDCSGLTRYVYREATGKWLPHSSYLQWLVGEAVPAGGLQPGDLVFFNTDGWGPSHVGVYIGGVDADFVDATDPRGGVQINTLYSAYWARHYVGARDILS